MNTFGIKHHLGWLVGLALTTLLAQSAGAKAQPDETFAVLQTRTGTYTNVTVTKKTPTCVFISHAGGIVNIQVPDLSDEILLKLGYQASLKNTEASRNSGSPNHSDPSITPQQIRQLDEAYRKLAPDWMPKIAISAQLVYTALGVALLFYLFFCYCSMLICRKTHTEPGPLVWVPLLQLFPLLRAAGMPPVWFLAFLVPLLNVVAQIVWYVKIVQARGKNIWVALLLLLPFTGPFAFLYLAFSSAAPFEIERETPIALQTA